MNNESISKTAELQRGGLFSSPVEASREYKGFLANLYTQARSGKPLPILVTGLCEGARTAFYLALASELREKFGRGFLAVVPEEKDALRISNAFADCGMKALMPCAISFINMVSSHEYEHGGRALDASSTIDIVLTLGRRGSIHHAPFGACRVSRRCVGRRRKFRLGYEKLTGIL